MVVEEQDVDTRKKSVEKEEGQGQNGGAHLPARLGEVRQRSSIAQCGRSWNRYFDAVARLRCVRSKDGSG
ncbi:hypothetical protein K440DRAFT_273846 [Wilcoxina mikolae CBS 423.85]|nr:hypothetical protein K440DRAFT_273846 [Wilcoxina mikolae CBS 423.85]